MCHDQTPPADARHHRGCWRAARYRRLPAGRITATIAKALAASWAKIGFRAELQERSAAEHARILRSGAYDLALASSEAIDATRLRLRISESPVCIALAEFAVFRKPE